MVNTLTREAGVKFGPLLLETLVKHYFDRFLKDSVSPDRATNKLRQEELLYDEAFIIVKTFLEAASKHTVEELQKFSNTRTPSPLWIHVVRVLVPTQCCDEAAEIVIRALGGEEMTKRLVGGTKWWQVRGLKGVDAEWIAAKKDWQDAKRRHKEQEKAGRTENGRTRSTTDPSQPGVQEDATPHYQPEMDDMPCILYTHGGGYYFGSVDQERYAIQRFARKINGRVFAINYRLAPQYPFPCALQDIIAAYLFLIRPPKGASHLPVNPARLTVAGDSAGGGLTIALMQVLRDCGLPLPAGAVLISPWCDLTHSFPSIHINTASDVVPPYGLSFAKPSTLWPPPPEEITADIREKLHTRIRQAVSLSRTKGKTKTPVTPESGGFDLRLPQTGQTLCLGSTASLPTVASGVRDQTVTCITTAGEKLSIRDQIHLYTPNYMLTHPLISPVVSYLGGLPPMLVIAGDGEVLRDEIIYMAHKAAHPERYPVSQAAKDMYPALNGIEERFGPTNVHLQVYDDAAHILPILFSFTTPAKYCFRAIATFIRYATGMLPQSASDTIGTIPVTVSPAGSIHVAASDTPQPTDETRPSRKSSLRPRSSPASREVSPRPRGGSLFSNGSQKMTEEPEGSFYSRRKSLRRALSAHASRAGILFRGGQANGVGQTSGNGSRCSLARTTTPPVPPVPPLPPLSPSPGATSGQATPERNSSDDVGGPRFYGSGHKNDGDATRRAGEPAVYQNGLNTMIRERISIHGVIRPLEPEGELTAFSLPTELIGVVSELAMRRYDDAKTRFDKKFARTYKTIEKHRRKHLEIAHHDALRTMAQLQNYFSQNGDDDDEKPQTLRGVGEGLQASASWSWAWALDVDERPPPSSIVARRDTHEAVQLARIADQSVLPEGMSGNNLWSLMVNFLTTTPDKNHKHPHHHEPDAESKPPPEDRESKRERIRSRFAQLVSDHKKHKDTPPAEG